jgi:glycine cleavage system H protein
MNIPPQLKYTKTHEWVRREADIAVVGITDHAQRELTDIVHVELPAPDTEVTAGDCCATVDSIKTASDIYAPVSGEIIAANDELAGAPELLNESPYDRGWIFKIRLRDPGELDELLGADDYAQLIGA